jgi:hypothetical protein
MSSTAAVEEGDKLKVKVLFFASARQATGVSSITIQLENEEIHHTSTLRLVLRANT